MSHGERNVRVAAEIRGEPQAFVHCGRPCDLPPGLLDSPSGINTDVLAGLKGMLKPENVSVFGLGVTPFFSVLFVIEFVKLIVPPLSRWETASPRNTRRLTLIVYFAALAMAGFQGRGVAHALYGITRLVDGPGWEIPIALTLVAGTALLGWLGDRVTAHGLGNGLWLLL